MSSSSYGACSEEGCRCLHFDEADSSPRVCDCGHKRCFHALLTDTSLPQNLSSLVAPIFKCEVNIHLTSHLSHSLPECGLSDFRTREVEENDQMLVEIDSFGYIYHDSLQYGVAYPGSGISLITPLGCSQVQAISAAPAKLSGLPVSEERSLDDSVVEKYVIVETYSGQNTLKMKQKVGELELKINKMIDRFRRQNTGYTGGDVTSVVGAAILAFSCGPMNRKDATSKFNRDVVTSTVAKDMTPSLWRLAQARRLYLVVMSANDSPISTAHRESFRIIVGLDIEVEEIGTRVEAMVENMKKSQQTMHTMLETIQESIGDIKSDKTNN